MQNSQYSQKEKEKGYGDGGGAEKEHEMILHTFQGKCVLLVFLFLLANAVWVIKTNKKQALPFKKPLGTWSFHSPIQDEKV